MRGSLREREKGVWELRVDLGADPVTGTRRQRSRTVHGGKRKAEDALRAFTREVERGKHVSTEGTVGFLLTSWLNTARPNLSPTTYDNYRRVVAKHLMPSVGHLPLSELDARHLDALYVRLLRELQPSTVHKVHAVMHRALAQAIRWNWIVANPAARATPPSIPKIELSPPAPAEARALAEKVKEADPNLSALIRLAAATGARRGELCALRRSDVNLDESSLLIARAVVQVGSSKNAEIRETKTKPRSTDELIPGEAAHPLERPPELGR